MVDKGSGTPTKLQPVLPLYILRENKPIIVRASIVLSIVEALMLFFQLLTAFVRINFLFHNFFF
jgi:hypothetical protein